MDWTAWLNREILDNTIAAWTLSLVLVAGVTVGLRLAFRFLLRRLERLAGATANDLDDLAVELLAKTKTLAILLVAVWAAARPLALSDRTELVLRGVLVAGLLLQIGFWGMGLTNYLMRRWRKRQLDQDPGLATAVGALGMIIKLGLWSVLVITALANLGVDITAFVASLGIGGIAVALALQNVLGDLFGSLSIVLDKPFVIGDFIVVGDLAGTVEYVGLKTTRIRSLSGEQLVISNSDLLSSRIHNFKRMAERRVVFGLGVTYDTPPEKLRLVPELVRAAIEAREHARFDRSHFKQFSDSSLDFESVYYVTVPDFNAYMDVQQAVNLELVERFAEEEIEFAFPTRTLHVMGVAAGEAATAVDGSVGPRA
jgi:small-conductance mechanosensitive channel